MRKSAEKQFTKFTEDDLVNAIRDLGQMPFFPKESASSIMTQLRRMMPHREALLWTVSTLINMPGPWPGIGELRGLLDSRYDPADGIHAWTSLPGFTAEEAEAKFLQREFEAAPERQKLSPVAKQILQIGARNGNH